MIKKFKRSELYDTPQIFYTSFSSMLVIANVYISLIFTAALALSIILFIDNISSSIYMFPISLIILSYYVCDFIHGNVLKRQYIEITKEHIKVKSLLRTKIIHWNKIYSVELRDKRFNSYIGIVRDDDIWLKMPSIIQQTIRIFEVFSIIIYLNRFHTLDGRKLYNTICSKLPSRFF